MSAAFASATFAQPGPLPAADSAKQGTDLYNAGDYAGAVAPLQRAVEMEPNNFEYRFMLAQALRQSGNCAEAMPQYKQLEASAPPERANDVKTAMAGCPSTDIKQPDAVPAPPPPPPPEPVVKSGLSRGNALMLMGAGAGIATSVCLLFAASNDASDADAAAKYDDHDRLSTRSEREYIGAAVAGGVGVVLGVIAFRRINSSNEGTQLSLRPRSGGGTLVLERSW
ncbi:MAG TPA: tetratricopeptide repeat protein [Kofleriaceae bacterium]|nr:tetratricopeptide repeat protein [Kofleriaceae bacterium]